MRHVLNLLQRFRRDESGAFAIIFAMLAIVLIAMSGAVVDFTSMQQARTRAQVALDAASLALQPRIYDSSADAIKTDAQKLLIDRLGDAVVCTSSTTKPPCASVATPVIDLDNGQLSLTATLKEPMNFVSLVGINDLSAQIVSVATRQKLNLEVALVLDNSGSMAYAIGYDKVVKGKATRMDTLHDAATCAANILFYGVSDCTTSVAGKTEVPNVKMAVVPFNDEVNVGKNNANADWLGRTGGSSVFTNDNFDFTLASNGTTAYDPATFDRISLVSALDSDGWGGCVEARKNNGGSIQYDTDDTEPDPAKPETMFTPLVAPDEPDSGSYSNNYTSDTPAACNKIGTCADAVTFNTTYNDVTVVVTAKGKYTTKDKNGNVTATGSVTTTFTTGPVSQPATKGSVSTSGKPTITTSTGATRQATGICSCTGQTLLTDTPVAGSASTNGNATSTQPVNATIPADVVTPGSKGSSTTNHYTSATSVTTTQPMKYNTIESRTCSASYAPWSTSTQTSGGLTPRQMQERICKYTGATAKSFDLGDGPNADCPATPIQPLTDVPSSVTSAITAMQPDGNTNIQEGAAWGFRVLSPSKPFTEGLAFGQANSKVMIVMTDGENTFNASSNMNGTTLYSAYAYPWDNYQGTTTARGRMGDTSWSSSDFETQINTRLAATCTNAKNAGIIVYTVGLATKNTSDPDGNKALLQGCATKTSYAYFPDTADDLKDDFAAIANQLAALRLAQ